jgi:hypothetical protein
MFKLAHPRLAVLRHPLTHHLMELAKFQRDSFSNYLKTSCKNVEQLIQEFIQLDFRSKVVTASSRALVSLPRPIVPYTHHYIIHTAIYFLPQPLIYLTIPAHSFSPLFHLEPYLALIVSRGVHLLVLFPFPSPLLKPVSPYRHVP